MTHEELLKLAEEEPAIVDATINALQRTIDFHKGRGAMLAAVRSYSPASST